MNKLCLTVCVFISLVSYSQKKDTIFTKLFFESGFKNTKVYVISLNHTLLSKKLTTDYKIGYAHIFSLKNKKYKNLLIKAGRIIKKVKLFSGKFYIINIRDNELLIDEVSEEPIYI